MQDDLLDGICIFTRHFVMLLFIKLFQICKIHTTVSFNSYDTHFQHFCLLPITMPGYFYKFPLPRSLK